MFIPGGTVPHFVYPSSTFSPVVIKHGVELHQDLGAEDSRERVDVQRAESQGEDSASQGEVLENLKFAGFATCTVQG